LELFATIAPERAKRISRQALRMKSYRDLLLLENVPVDQRSMLFSVKIIPERHHLEFAEHVRKFSDSHDLDADLRSLCAGMIPILAQELLDGRLR
jgi:hypothetical protein